MTQRKDPADLKPRGFQKGGAAFKAPTGRGYGGGANGAGAGGKSIQNHPHFTAENNPGGTVSARNAARREKAYAVLDRGMDDPDMRTAIQAADKMLDRIEGRAVQKTVSLSKDEYEQLSDRELADEQARIDAALSAGQNGTTTPPGAGGLGDVVY